MLKMYAKRGTIHHNSQLVMVQHFQKLWIEQIQIQKFDEICGSPAESSVESEPWTLLCNVSSDLTTLLGWSATFQKQTWEQGQWLHVKNVGSCKYCCKWRVPKVPGYPEISHFNGIVPNHPAIGVPLFTETTILLLVALWLWHTAWLQFGHVKMLWQGAAWQESSTQ